MSDTQLSVLVPGVIVLAIGVDVVAAIAWMRTRWR